MVNDKQVERRNLRMTVARRHHRARTWSINLRPICFESVEVRRSARDRCMRMAPPIVRRVPSKCAMCLRARRIDGFSARYLSVQKDHNLQENSARSNFSSMESARFAVALQGLQTTARRERRRRYPEVLPHQPAVGDAIGSATAVREPERLP